MLGRPLTGELGIRKVLFDEVAELGVSVVVLERWVALGAGPNMEWFAPGVEGCAMVMAARLSCSEFKMRPLESGYSERRNTVTTWRAVIEYWWRGWTYVQ